jgi:hypothetical protein
MLLELRAERENLEQAIITLERLAVGSSAAFARNSKNLPKQA